MSALYRPHMSNSKVAGEDDNGFEKMAYKLPEVAVLLGLSEITVRRLVSRGLLRPIRAVRHLMFARTEILRFLAEN